METKAQIEQIFRDHHRRLFAWLVGRLRDFDAAEDALQEAFLLAVRRWPEDGVPPNPGAWLAVTARNRALDRLRRDSRRPELEAQMTHLPMEPDPGDLDDDVLRLIFTCCNPALSSDARVALTLRAVCGLEPAEIASAFLIPETTLAQRLVRAKRKIRVAGIPYQVPSSDMLAERLAGVLSVIYLVYNEGYVATRGPALTRVDLSLEAIRLARLLVALMPREPEVRALLALFLLTDARRPARADSSGAPVLLPDQDRTLWDRSLIDEGLAELRLAAGHARAGPYVVQAAIAAEHSIAARAEDTDWPRIVTLYDALILLTPSPVARLNRLVAVSMASGPNPAYEQLRELEPALVNYPCYHATRADLLRRLDRREDARHAYRRALELSTNPMQRAALARAAAELE